MTERAFLSFRLPVAQRDRVKAIAAKRGESVQDMLGRVVETFLDGEERLAPSLTDLLKRLRGHKQDLQRRGIAKLWVFGSVVRSEARPDSDVDLIVEFSPEAKISLTGFARLRQDLSQLLQAPVDLAEWRTLRSHVRRSAEDDAVQVF